MKRIIIVFAVMAALIIPSISSAAPLRPGLYVSGFAGVSVPRDAEPTTVDYGGSTIRTFNENIEFDPGPYVGGTAGFDFGFLRVEGELSYRYSEIKSVTDKSDNFSYFDVDGNLSALSMMGNAFIDLHNPSPITPYFGGGIGFAVLHMDSTTGIDTRGGSTGTVLLYPKDDDTVFAYQAGAGVEIALNPRISLDVGYRYFGTDNAEFQGNSLDTTKVKFESHNAMVGVRIKF